MCARPPHQPHQRCPPPRRRRAGHNYEFGFVWGARRSGDDLTLTFDPAGMLLGRQAKAYYDAHPSEERLDFKILDDKSLTQALRVPASATLYGNQMLGPRNGSRNERVDLARLLARAAGKQPGRARCLGQARRQRPGRLPRRAVPAVTQPAPVPASRRGRAPP